MKRTLMRLLPVFMAALMIVTALAGCLNNSGDDLDTPEFVALLEYANTLPDDYDWDNYEHISEVELITSSRQIIAATSMHDFYNYQMYRPRVLTEIRMNRPRVFTAYLSPQRA